MEFKLLYSQSILSRTIMYLQKMTMIPMCIFYINFSNILRHTGIHHKFLICIHILYILKYGCSSVTLTTVQKYNDQILQYYYLQFLL